MRRVVALLLIAILGTMPLMGMASSANSGSLDMQDMPCHESAPKPEPAADGDCDSCAPAGLCCCIAFILPAPVLGASIDAVESRIAGEPAVAAGIVIPPLDPPPLVS